VIILGLDPGTTKSQIVVWDGERVSFSAFYENADCLTALRQLHGFHPAEHEPLLAMERFESMGASVGKEVFETVYWSGRFHEAYELSAGRPPVGVTRRQVKLHLCNNMRATDAWIRTALMDRFGGAASVGTKKAPGPLHGVSGHGWAALAVAVTCLDQLEGRP